MSRISKKLEIPYTEKYTENVPKKNSKYFPILNFFENFPRNNQNIFRF